IYAFCCKSVRRKASEYFLPRVIMSCTQRFRRIMHLFLVQGAVVATVQYFVCFVESIAQRFPSHKPASLGSAIQQQPKIWLSLDVVEHQYSAAGAEVGKERYRADVELQVIDSTTSRSVIINAGETMPLMPNRTYYILLPEIPQSYGMTTRLVGPQTQLVRTPKVVGKDDIMIERKFVLTSRPKTNSDIARRMPPQTMNRTPVGVQSPTLPRPPYTALDTDNSVTGVSSPLTPNLSSLNYYVIQYCSLRSQEDAMQARLFLMRNGVRDARVEVYIDGLGQTYYRLRSGSYPDASMAKAFIEQSLWKNRHILGLKQKPIVVKAGV
ncbi:MAG: SPOR domain-containing protein, partial [Bacteroidota bacterium]|nr:SPOR domain-containing protein [Candidatus Kapabacteria bacterium]MDW8219108.1 SPOR domain-containing protein [Bacteroidota bacterium]